MSSDIYLALGANQGNREQNLIASLEWLEGHGVQVIRASGLYETEPVGYQDQGWFLNAVVRVQTDHQPEQLLELIRQVETELGRERTVLNGPRTIDLDILIWGSEVIQTDSLTIPHPRMQDRLFVLRPFAEIGDEVIHPLLNTTIGRLLERLPIQEEVRLFRPSFYPARPLPPSQL